MMRHSRPWLTLGVALVLLARASAPVPAAEGKDPLPSWNDGPAKKAIVAFVERVTTPGGKDYVRPEDRIATFDNDGTLWCEQPLYFQTLFAVARVKELVPGHPEWKTRQPFRAALEDDHRTLAQVGEKGFTEMAMAGHAGMTPEQLDRTVRAWLASARHPRFRRPYTDLVYQPMLELLAHLRARGFKTFIVSGGGIEFMRVWTGRVYGIPPEQVVGSSTRTVFEMRDGRPTLFHVPQVDFVDNGPGKAVGIHRFIGKRPILAFGNSDGDLEMLQYTTMTGGPRLGALIHHTDADREYAYDRKSDIGQLDRALDEARPRGWVVVDMKKEWKVIFPFQK